MPQIDLREEHPDLFRISPRRGARVTGWLLLAALVILGGLAATVVIVGSDRPAPGEAAAAPTPAADAYVPATMPDVLGARLPRAIDLIVDAELHVAEVRFAPGPERRVVASEPTAGEAVTAGTGVSLWIGSG
jgi:hypothetical protein